MLNYSILYITVYGYAAKMLMAVIRLMLLPNIDLSQKVLYVIEPVLFIGSWCYGTIC